jgi:hypothetical protein
LIDLPFPIARFSPNFFISFADPHLSRMSFSKMRPGGSRDTALEVDANDRVIEPRVYIFSSRQVVVVLS